MGLGAHKQLDLHAHKIVLYLLLCVHQVVHIALNNKLTISLFSTESM
jgi:hypothetical protein